ncbi:DMT family transporter [Leptospira interrogans]
MLNFFLLALMPAAFSLNAVVGRALTGLFLPAQLTTVRWLGAAALVALVALWGSKRECWRPGPQGWARILILGAFGMGFCSYAAFAGAQASSATNVGLIYTTTAALVVLFEIVTRQARASTLLILGVALSIVGVATIVTKGHLNEIAQISFNVGDLWAVGGTISWAGYTVAMKRQKSDFTPLALFVVMGVAGALAATPFAVLETAVSGPPVINAMSMTWIAAGIIISSVGSYLSYNLALRRCGPILTSAALTLSSVYTALFAVLLVNEQLGWFHVAGGALVIGGLGLINLQRFLER